MSFMRRSFRDRDYIQTVEDFLFCVVGGVHPADRVISYVKYIPSRHGDWEKNEKRFQRLMRSYTMLNLIKTLDFLEEYPQYLYESDVMGIRISAVPLNRIVFHFRPEEKMRKLAEAKRKELDELQNKALKLAIALSEKSGVPLKYFGVTGSILLDIHQPFSDIDLTIYGIENSKAVKETLRRIYSVREASISRLKGAKAEEWCLNKSRMYPLTYDEAKVILSRKWNRGVFQGTMFSIHPIKLEDELSEKYGDRIFRPKGMIKIEATVSDSSESEFMPSIYIVENVKILSGPNVKDIREVTSYEGLYGGIADEGEKIIAYGKLEMVVDKRKNEEYYRVLIGSQKALGRDYIKPLL